MAYGLPSNDLLEAQAASDRYRRDAERHRHAAEEWSHRVEQLAEELDRERAEREADRVAGVTASDADAATIASLRGTLREAADFVDEHVGDYESNAERWRAVLADSEAHSVSATDASDDKMLRDRLAILALLESDLPAEALRRSIREILEAP